MEQPDLPIEEIRYLPTELSSIPSFYSDSDKRVLFGSETEYGLEFTCDGERVEGDFRESIIANICENVGRMTRHGGRIYWDGIQHLEYATPEVRSPFELTARIEVGDREVLNLVRSIAKSHNVRPFIYRQNVSYDDEIDGNSNQISFGNHESYLIRMLPDENLGKILMPNLTTRQILIGSGGLIEDDGETIQVLSPRALFIDRVFGTDTQKERRPIFCLRIENHTPLAGYYRLHLISGDANMSEASNILKFGQMHLVLRMLEEGILPKIEYDSDAAVADIHNLSLSWGKAELIGVLNGPKTAIEIQQLYYDAAMKNYWGENEQINSVLYLWGDSLNKLRSDPSQLKRRLDHAIIREFLDTLISADGLTLNSPLVKSNALMYSSIDPKNSLYFNAKRHKLIERWLSPELKDIAFNGPPKNTRAFCRGRLVEILSKKYRDNNLLEEDNWSKLVLFPEGSRSTFDLTDPFDSYAPTLQQIIKSHDLE